MTATPTTSGWQVTFDVPQSSCSLFTGTQQKETAASDNAVMLSEDNTMTIKPVVKNLLALVAGVITGSLVNMLLVKIGPSLVPLPEGADVSTMESLRDSMVLFTPVNFIFPFLAHALGTLAGAFIVARFAANHHLKFALAVGVFFLIGGISAVIMLGGPLWFNLTDILLAYIPMSILGANLANRTRSETT